MTRTQTFFMVKLLKDEFRFDPSAPIVWQDDDTQECVAAIGMTRDRAERIFAKPKVEKNDRPNTSRA